MTISMVEKIEDDIKTALNAESGFLQPNFTFFSAENDDDEDVDFGKWLSVAIEQLEVIEDARYQEKLSKRKIQEGNHD